MPESQIDATDVAPQRLGSCPFFEITSRNSKRAKPAGALSEPLFNIGPARLAEGPR
jgi:hypothetical protein